MFVAFCFVDSFWFFETCMKTYTLCVDTCSYPDKINHHHHHHQLLHLHETESMNGTAAL